MGRVGSALRMKRLVAIAERLHALRVSAYAYSACARALLLIFGFTSCKCWLFVMHNDCTELHAVC